MLSRLLRIAAGVLAASLLVTGCTATGAQDTGGADGTGGTLKIAMSAGNVPQPEVLPDQGQEGIRFVANNIYDGLTRLNLDQASTLPTPQPGLATSWTRSADNLTWTFVLRQGVKFSDGTPFDADAVLFNLRRASDKGFQYYSPIVAARTGPYFQQIKSYTADNDHQVSITTKAPYSFLPYDLLTVFIASPTAVQKWGNADYLNHATGTGPFVVDKYENNVEMTLKRNPDYWDGPAKLDEIVLYPQPEASSRVASLQSGAVNWAEVPSPDSISLLKGQDYQVFLDDASPAAIMPQFNMFRAPFKDNLKLRQALNYALNRAATAATINNAGAPANQYVVQASPYYVKDEPGYAYDLAKAKQLLSEAGYGPGKAPLTLNMVYPPDGSGNMFPGPMAEQMQADFGAIGVKLTLTPLEFNSYLSIYATPGGLSAPQWSKYDIIWAAPAAGMLPTGFARLNLCSLGGVANAVGYCDQAVDQAYNAAAASFDIDTQNKDLRQMNKVLLDDAPVLFWINDRNLRSMASTVHGYVQAQSRWVDFTKMWVG
ncbi:ABC transporter substrate-binding protein [Amycolatopsis sp. GM8]|uniref:ABC transporter substrate-binding protein n=1 Tax=Amycolatopsis sp. GM8 TaxID=2896530 RepID=UPI001F1A79F8|nr:ABC transporter substrate-binding protein [Amycolatopsis sp. GM8]